MATLAVRHSSTRRYFSCMKHAKVADDGGILEVVRVRIIDSGKVGEHGKIGRLGTAFLA